MFFFSYLGLVLVRQLKSMLWIASTNIPLWNISYRLAGKKPPKGWFTLNMYGLALGNSGRVGDGGLLCNSDGNWVNGFTRGSGNTNSCLAELWALRDGLNIAFDLGILYLGSVWIELIFAETENWNWKHCSEIVFKCVNSTVRLIFNEKLTEKWNLWDP